ncbi:MAG TPA: glycosyltransferase family A protein [Waterburya sp.]|jgi:glycosyltransferase involved in cell wall biosynthesis
MSDPIKPKPLVSIITNFFNAEKYFEEAIESVFAQTYNNWELLLVDDGSTDSSTVIALRYAQQYPEKVRYLEHEGHANRGRCAARNLGIEKARGEYIAFLDADDVYLPQKLEQQLALMDAHPEAAVVFGPTQYWHSWTGKPEDKQRDSFGKLWIPPNQFFHPPKLLTLLLQSKANPPATCSVLMRRELFAEVGSFDDTVRDVYEDKAFFAKVYLKAPVFVHSQSWDNYRQHPESTCAVAQRTGWYHPYKPNPAHQTYLNWMTEYLSQEGVKDAEIWQALQNALWPYRHPRLYSLWYPLKHFLDRIKYRLHCLGREL